MTGVERIVKYLTCQEKDDVIDHIICNNKGKKNAGVSDADMNSSFCSLAENAEEG